MRSIKRFTILALVCALALWAGDKKPSDPGTVIAGSVFRDTGFALPEATVSLVRRDDPKHKKLAENATGSSGEFVFRVPTAPAVYVVKASAKGYCAEEKEASITGPDRVDLTFKLEPETRK